MAENQLYYGDNLEVLPNLASESVDLVYIDPPFNSAKNYNVIFARTGETQDAARAQIHAFEDTWVWTQATEQQYLSYVSGGLPNRAAEALTAFRTLLGENDAMAYLVNMAPRLVQLHRVLKKSGSLFLHCDPTMSHYLKVLLDSIFDPRNFVNEIVWHYNTGGAGKRAFSRKHDVILMFAKDEKSRKFNTQREPFREEKTQHFTETDEDGRKYRVRTIKGKDYIYYLDEGRAMHDVWDIDALNAQAKERLGYPTQKPVALLERIIQSSTDEGDIVLDAFCGCGTSVDAAIRLKRRWIGMDITYIAIDLIEKRLLHTFGDQVKDEYTVAGIPRDAAGAMALFKANAFDFERWAVSQINAQPNEKQVGDKGIDGVARFPLDSKTFGRIIVSVKGGKKVNPTMARDLEGTVLAQKAEMGVLILQTAPTPGITEVMNHSGTYTHPATGGTFPKLQVITVAELLAGKKPNLPQTSLPYIQASRAASETGAAKLF